VPEAVDRLELVADEEALVSAPEELDDSVWSGRVLELVDEDLAEAQLLAAQRISDALRRRSALRAGDLEVERRLARLRLGVLRPKASSSSCRRARSRAACLVERLPARRRERFAVRGGAVAARLEPAERHRACRAVSRSSSSSSSAAVFC
jgi:hypothetical protein